MKGIAIATVVVALASAAPLAGLPSGPACCACIEGHLGQTSQASNGTLTEAVFCATQPLINTTSNIGERCTAVTDGSGLVLCIVGGSNETCRTQLAGEGIACPSSGAPTAGPLNLLALAVTLGAAGITVLRRRARRDD